MRIAVLGGGVIGVASAYYLAREGHEVTLIERHSELAAETSFANAGMIAPGHAFAWASPRAPKILLQSLWRDDTALRFKLKPDPRLWAWSWKFLMQCTAERNRANTLVKLKLCLLSKDETAAVREKEQIRYDEVLDGAIYLYRDQAHLETGLATVKLLSDNGLQGISAINREELARREPALAPVKDKLAGALYAASDESGDCRSFTLELAKRCREMGVTFRLGESIKALRDEKGQVTAVVTDKGDVKADAFVVCLASYAPQVLKTAGLSVPIYPVKGYSLTLPAGSLAPRLAGVDEKYLVAFSRMGDKLRLTATAEFAGYDTRYKPDDFKPMLRVAKDLFPDGADYLRPSYWACLRPMTPDGPPIVGASRLQNLWFNTGHGHIGWTMACGSARLLSDLIAGRKPPIPIDGLQPSRFAA